MGEQWEKKLNMRLTKPEEEMREKRDSGKAEQRHALTGDTDWEWWWASG